MPYLQRLGAAVYVPGIPPIDGIPATPEMRSCPGGSGSNSPGTPGGTDPPPPGTPPPTGPGGDPPVSPCNTYCAQRNAEGECIQTGVTC